MDGNHYVIGTAGHIDHGKTMLTRALTGVDTDRLKEEKERSISIEPGFAPLRFSDGWTAAIVDVPGHERFIRQMVAGVAGIDFVLLVVAADDGVMPQTREHLSILHLLGVEAGIVVLSKIDRGDPELLPLIEEDLREITAGTFLEQAPILRVSAVTGEGVEDLKREIGRRLPRLPARGETGPFRLPVDRAFTVKGAGTVVTGTVRSGRAEAGAELEVLPGGPRVKVRQVQVHGESVPAVRAGQRAALNLSAASKQDLYRGQTLVQTGAWRSTDRLDVRAVSLPEIGFGVKERSRVTLMIGTAEVLAELILYDRKQWSPGEEVYASLRLEEPVIAGRGDRFILRRPTPADTIGGGEVVEPYPRKRKVHLSSAEAIRAALTADLGRRILRMMEEDGWPADPAVLSRHLGETMEAVTEKLEELAAGGEAVRLGSRWAARSSLDRRVREMTDWLDGHHRDHPMRPGLPKAEWLARFLPGLPMKEAAPLLSWWEAEGILRQDGEFVARRDFRPGVPEDWNPSADRLLSRLREEGLSPSDWKTLLAESGVPAGSGAELRQFWIRSGQAVPLTEGLLLHREAFGRAVGEISRHIRESGSITVQEAKELLGLSRKYLVPLLEKMDQSGITRRDGDRRLLTAGGS